MKSIEFMYWLQGYFEVCNPDVITPEQSSKIKNHLNMVEITDKKEIWPFCSWLIGFMDASDDLNADKTNKIKTKLNAIFEHVVTPPVAPPPGVYLHQTGTQLPPGVMIKC